MEAIETNDTPTLLQVGRYVLEERIGRGGGGEVWLARHRMLGRRVAVKLVRTDISAADQLTRFRQEAQAMAALQSPHTAELHDFGMAEDGRLYYVMEYLQGLDLQTLVDRFGTLPEERVIRILRQVCASLAEAHRMGLVHCDIKPANLFLGPFALRHDFVKVLDFGLVRPEPRPRAAPPREDRIHGTPSFMAPEQANGYPVDARADLYSLGCVAWWLLTSRQVFEASSPTLMLLAQVEQEPGPVSEWTELPISDGLQAIIMSCLAKDPDDRPRSAEDLSRQLGALEKASAWTDDRARRWWTEQLPDQCRCRRGGGVLGVEPWSETLPLVSVMAADGRVHPAEERLLERLLETGGQLPVPADLVRVHTPQSLTPPRTMDDRQALLRKMVRMAHVDGHRSEAEWEVVMDYARHWGVDEALLNAMDRDSQRRMSSLRRLWLFLDGLFSETH